MFNKLKKIKINGPWQDEPDQIRWFDLETGYQCYIKRSLIGGFLCGYVVVPKDHILHSNANDIDNDIDYDNLGFEVHGGITFFGKFDGVETYIGFDCGHFDDFIPYSLVETTELSDSNQNYKDIHFVKNQCSKLAKQLKNYKPKK
jgi:hypothetical protein